MRRLIFWLILIVVLFNFGPAILQGLSQGLADAAREMRGEIAANVRSSVSGAFTRRLPWGARDAPVAGSVTAVGGEYATMEAEFEQCMVTAVARAGDQTGQSCLDDHANSRDRDACLTRKLDSAYRDENFAAVDRQNCLQHLGASYGTSSAIARLWGAATRWLRCRIQDLAC